MNQTVNMIYRIAEGISKLLNTEIESLEIKTQKMGTIECKYGYVTLAFDQPITFLIREDGSFEKKEKY